MMRNVTKKKTAKTVALDPSKTEQLYDLARRRDLLDDVAWRIHEIMTDARDASNVVHCIRNECKKHGELFESRELQQLLVDLQGALHRSDEAAARVRKLRAIVVGKMNRVAKKKAK